MTEYLSDSMWWMIVGTCIGLPGGYALAKVEDIFDRYRRHHDHT